MSRKLYTENEIILCAYLALYDTNAFLKTEIHNKFSRPKSSIKMKIQKGIL